jgi:hypothetical protein
MLDKISFIFPLLYYQSKIVLHLHLLRLYSFLNFKYIMVINYPTYLTCDTYLKC